MLNWKKWYNYLPMDKLTRQLYIDKKTFVRIFKENWDRYKRLCGYRKVEDENVQRLLGCGDPENGFIQLRCTNCGEKKIIPFSCKSRLCPSCTHIHLQERIMKIKSIMIKGVGHRHVVLTTPKELRSYFLKDRFLLKIMADAGAVLIKDILVFYRKEGVEPGIILIIQTAGRALNFNPHLHLLITEGGLSRDGRWYSLSHISEDLLGRKWQYFLLTRLKGYLPKNERTRKLIDKLFEEKPLFITHAKKEKKRKVDIVGYLVKYVISPPISYRRIVTYKDDEVTFRYHLREERHNRTKKLTVLGFIHLLVQHIPEENQKMIHYYGLYARPQAKKLKKVVEDIVRSTNQEGWEAEQEKLLTEILSFPTTYRERIKLTFNKDPCICPVCGEEMVTERIVGPGGCIIFDIYQTDYFQDITDMEDRDVQSFQEEKEQRESPRYHQLLLPTM